ncbi:MULTISPECIES: formate dehydrogenase accessory sulfurtransferase FdhD [Psychrobacter]|uniref:formate dehydrogenase accessory sulfurtransferase FdhD n=1 Tax=Psychrobacter TaxID=497 RepID=UPI000C345393|nr:MULTISPECIES: formate dehydrogenase accessory sulfurtransferase FdhD [Psychrobacter]PKG36846.1 sulfurtransferase FdhD [Psychrobacter sp. Sarcosine-3u-12]
MAKLNTQASAVDMSEATAESTVTPLSRAHLVQKYYYAPIESGGSQQAYIEDQSANLVVEAAISIIINGIHYAVLMASPYQLEYLAIGFLFSEGLIQHSHDLLDWEVTQLTDMASYQRFTQDSMDENDTAGSFEQTLAQLQDYDIYVVELTLNQRSHQRIQAQRRQLAGRTGCGMCGITGLTQALPNLSHYKPSSDKSSAYVSNTYSQDGLQDDPESEFYDESQNKLGDSISNKSAIPSFDYLLQIRAQVDATQHTHQLTGAVHAAATMQGQRLHLFEDVGRHNALDKLIGWQLRHRVDVDCVVMTSRLSIELVQKSIRSQIPWLVGMSAPTSTAVRVAERYGLGLAGFLRNNRVTYYSGF